MIMCIICVVGCVLMLIPCQNKAFLIIYLVLTIVHYVFTWIWALDHCVTGGGGRGFFEYGICEFIMITVVFVGEVIINFKIDIKLSPA